MQHSMLVDTLIQLTEHEGIEGFQTGLRML